MELCLIIHNIYRNPAESISQNVNQNQNPTFIFRMDSDNKVIVKSFYNRNTKSVNAIVWSLEKEIKEELALGP